MAERTGFWIVIFAAYFLIHVGIRLATGGALGLDEAQIFRHAQSLAWGYGPQPPLYAWLQYGVFQILGENLLSLTLFKNVLLFLMVTVWFLLFRREASVSVAGLCACALILVPQFSWESQRALTHSVIAGTMTAVLYAAFWTILKRREYALLAYVVLGVVLAAGTLSKPTFLTVPIGILLATLSMPTLRAALSVKGLLISLITALVLCSPYIWWSLENLDATLASSAKFEMMASSDVVQTLFLGVVGLLSGLTNFMIFPALVLGAIWASFGSKSRGHSPLFFRWILRCVVACLLVVLFFVLVSQSTNVKDRWLQAVLMPLTPALVFLLLSRISDAGRRWLVWVYAFCAVLVSVGQPFHSLWGKAYRAAPYAELSQALVLSVDPEATIIADDWVAGNLMYQGVDRNFQTVLAPLTPGQDYVYVSQSSNLPFTIDTDGVIARDGGHWRLRENDVLSALYRFAKQETFTLYVTQIRAVEN